MLRENAKKITGRADFDLGFDFGKIKENFKIVYNNIKKLIPQWGKFFIEIGLKIADDINIGTIITKITTLIAKVFELASAFSDVMIPVLREFYDKNLKPIFEDLGKTISKNIDKAISKVQKLIDYFNNSGKATDEMSKKLDNMWKVFNGDKEASGVLEHLAGILGALVGIVKNLIPIIKDLAKSFGNFVKNELLPWLLEKLNELKDWIAKNKDKIVELIKKIGSIAWGVFKIFVDIVSKLVDIIVKHPNSVYVFFASLLALKVASWAVSTAAGIGHLVNGLQGFASLFSSGGALASVGTKISGIFSSMGSGITSAVAIIKNSLSTASTAISGFISNSGILTGAGASTASGVAMASGMTLAGLGIGAYEAKKTYDRREELFGKEEGNTTSAKVTSTIGGFLGGSGGGLADETASAGKKAEQVGISALKGAALGGAIGSVIPGVGTAIGAAVGGVVGTVTGAIGGDNIAKALNGAWESTKNVVSGACESIKSGASKTGEVINDTWENVKNSASEKWSNIKNTVNNTFENTKTGASIVWSFISNGASNMSNFINTTIGNMGNAVNNIFVGIKNTVGNIFSNIGTVVSNIFSGINNTINNVGNTVKNVFNNALKTISSISSSIGSVVGNVFKDISSTISNVGSTIKGVFNGIYNTVSSTLSGLFGKVKNIVSSLTGGISDAVDKVGKFIGGARDILINGWNIITGKSSAKSAKKITTHAGGGSIAGGGLYIANEQGKPELIGKITGGSGTDVANNGMIVQAMTNGVFDGVYNALAEINNQRALVGGGATNAKIEINGFGLIDSSTIGELARMLAPYLSSNNKNIADINFSI